MLPSLQNQIEQRARAYYAGDDPSHDFSHIQRVLDNALTIQKTEGGDLDIIIPAIYFHDAVNHPKNHPKANDAPKESANVAERELQLLADYPAGKIPAVKTAIIEHSFGSGITPETLESKIVQDADRLEATGAVSIMRTFASTGQFKSPFYHAEDPFCKTREPDPKKYALDLFPARLLKVKDMMNTAAAHQMAADRTDFLLKFLEQLRTEISLDQRG